jgi:tRNA A-37 threonylcarbamoyl transferase component Bud32
MSEATEFESQILAFEQAWQQTSPVSLSDFLATLEQPIPYALLLELVCIDLEFRWKRYRRDGTTLRPSTLEEYVARHQQLGSLDKLPLELIADEYHVRHRWGDRPTKTDFLTRFELRQPEIKAALDQIDRELSAEGQSTPRQPVVRVPHSRENASDPRAPLAYADYVLEELLGAGRTGKVYRALQRSLDRHVAIKYLRKSLMRAPSAVERFVQEAKTIARLRHPAIASIHGLGKTPNSYFLAMDLIEGVDLASRVSDGSITAAEAVDWTIQACEAIEHAHERGIVHCDLKPGNLLLDRQGRIHVTDFGFARTLGENTLAEARIEGTATFMAPEQIASYWGSITPLTDVYGLGALLFTLLAGRPPWSGRRLPDVLSQVVSATSAPSVIRFRADVPPQVAEICARCLMKPPNERYTSAAELKQALCDVPLVR